MAAKEILKFMTGKTQQDPYDFGDLFDLLIQFSKQRGQESIDKLKQANYVGTAQAATGQNVASGYSSSDTVAPGRLPIEGRITVGYGAPASWFRSGVHPGIDIAAPAGTPIPSVGEGRVISAGPEGNWGNSVVIQLPNGNKARYAHLSQINVREGDTIGDNQIIGTVGSTGYSTGNHLHYQIYR